MITAKEREESFKKDLKELLRKYDAEMDIEEISKTWYSQPVIFISMDSRFDEEANTTHEYCELYL